MICLFSGAMMAALLFAAVPIVGRIVMLAMALVVVVFVWLLPRVVGAPPGAAEVLRLRVGRFAHAGLGSS